MIFLVEIGGVRGPFVYFSKKRKVEFDGHKYCALLLVRVKAECIFSDRPSDQKLLEQILFREIGIRYYMCPF